VKSSKRVVTRQTKLKQKKDIFEKKLQQEIEHLSEDMPDQLEFDQADFEANELKKLGIFA